MEFSSYYLLRSLEDSLPELVSESAGSDFDIKNFVRENRKSKTFKRHVLDFSGRHPQARNCDVEESVARALSDLAKKNPSGKSSAKRLFKKQVDDHLSQISKKSKDAKKKLSCLKSIKSFSSKGMDMEEIIGRAKSILTGKERMSLELCSSGHSVREMALIMKVSFPTAWRILNRAIDKVRVSHGMKSRHKDKR